MCHAEANSCVGVRAHTARAQTKCTRQGRQAHCRFVGRHPHDAWYLYVEVGNGGSVEDADDDVRKAHVGDREHAVGLQKPHEEDEGGPVLRVLWVGAAKQGK